MENSCPHQAQQEDLNREVQGPMPKTPLHARLEGFRESREAEAIAATQYVLPKLFWFFANPYLDIFPPNFAENRAIGIEVICYILPDYLLTISFTDLTIGDTPKKNAKGKRVAQQIMGLKALS